MRDDFVKHIDQLKRLRDWGDAELADQIGLPNRQYLAKIRNGEKPVPIEVKIQTWDLLGYAMTRESILSLLPVKFAERLRQVDNKRNRKMQGADDKENG